MHAVMHDPGGPKSVYTEQFSLVEYSCIDCSYMQLHPYYTHITQWMQTMLFFMSLFHFFFFFWPVQIGHLISSTFYQISSKIAVGHTFFNIHHTFLSEKNRPRVIYPYLQSSKCFDTHHTEGSWVPLGLVL